MTIAIFGDSYGLGYGNGWPSLIGDVTNYSIGGSSFDYSYFQFLNNHHKHDTIIFVVTSTTRGSIFTTKNNTPKHLAFYQNTNYADLKQMNKRANYLFDSRLTKTIKNEVQKNMHYDSNIVYHTAYLDSIKYQRPDTHIIFAFDFLDRTNGSMINVSKLDWQALGLKEDDDHRYCHMSPQQNREFANYIQCHINGEIDIHTTMTSPQEFYTTSNSKEEAGWK